jgi:phosphatidylglycerophosphate synthase
VIAIDATTTIDERLLALEPAYDSPWLLHVLSLVSEADDLSEITVHCPQAHVTKIKELVSHQFTAVTITDDAPPHDSVPLDTIYPRRKLLTAIRKQAVSELSSPVIQISSPADVQAAAEFLYKDARGHRTPVLRYAYRPISRQMAKVFIRVGLTPNSVTLLALGSALGAAFAIATGEYMWGLVGAILINGFTFFDLADGDVARLSGKMSKFGYWFDSIVDSIFEISMIIAFGAASIVIGGPIWAIPALLWLLTHTTLETNRHLEESQTTRGPSEPMPHTPDGNRGRIVQTVLSSITQPEIMRGIFAIGLIAGIPGVVTIFFAVHSSYRVLRMFGRAYGGYRKTLKDVNTK